MTRAGVGAGVGQARHGNVKGWVIQTWPAPLSCWHSVSVVWKHSGPSGSAPGASHPSGPHWGSGAQQR